MANYRIASSALFVKIALDILGMVDVVVSGRGDGDGADESIKLVTLI